MLMKFLAGFFTCFSLYSAIPVPQFKWEKGSMQYALCFFPLIGVIIGSLQLLWYWLCVANTLSGVLFAAVAALLPLLVTGGIHMDGFIDTVDALSSHAVREKKLEILQDPHVGAFGIIGCAGYLLLQFGLWHQIYEIPTLVALPAISGILSRALNGLSIATFPTAKSSGLVHLFAENAEKKVVVAVCAAFTAAACALSMCVCVIWGGVMTVLAGALFLLHLRFCTWEFGGNTGDLAGFLLLNVELLCLFTAVLGGILS